jgi:hypothetical protein
MVMRRVVSLLVALFVVSSVLLAGCSGGNNQTGQPTKNSPGKLVDWKYEATIKEAISVTCDKQPVTCGKLITDGVQLTIPAKTFESITKLTLENPKSVPQVMSNEFSPIGAPVDISGAESRLNNPATVTFQVDKTKFAADLKSGNIWIAYYNGKDWDYFPPAKTDAATGVITFDTYHFSLFGVGKVSVEEQIKQYTQSASLAALAQKKVDKLVENLVANVVDMILLDQLKWQDSSTKYKIVSSLANDDEYRNLVELFANKDYEKFNATLQVFAGKQIVKYVDKAAFLGILKGVSGNANMIGAAAEAAGYLAEGQLAEAGRILGQKIANGFLITKLVNAGAEVVQYNINLWKDAEIEAAFQAFKNGSDNKFWGYNVDPGDFEGLWNQMRGIATRLQSEAVEREKKRRVDLGLPPASESQLNVIREQVKKDMEDNFKTRLSQESELEKEAARLQSLVKIFQDTRLLEIGIYGYSEANDTLELRLDKLFHMVGKILRDTGRNNWNTTAFTNDKEISANDMVSLIKAWYSTDGEEEYAKLLKEKFGIDINVKKYILESGKPVVKSVTEDTKDFFGNKFQIIVGSAMMGPGSGQFSSSIAWGGSPTRYTGFMSSIGFWSSPPNGINPGDQVSINLQLIPSYESKTTATFTEIMTVLFNKKPVGELGWNNSSKETTVEKTITFIIPADFKGDSFDIEVMSSVPSGSGSEVYHFILNPDLAAK